MVRFALLTALILAALPAQALAQGPFGPFGQPQEDYGPGVSVGGAGLARVTAPRQLTEESVEQAIDAARPRAVARAVADARRRAEAIAAVVGASLGSVEAAELGAGFVEQASLYGYEPILGAFAPGTYCRTFRRVIVRQDPDTGLRRVVGRRRVRRCFSPGAFQVSLEATYLAQGG